MPTLHLVSTTGDGVLLSELGPGRTIIYIYPLTGGPGVDLPRGWDEIPGARGCTTEACDFRDHNEDLRDAGVVRLFGLSSQETPYQQELVERLNLPFPMLSDPALDLAEALNLPSFEAGGQVLFKRVTLVIVEEMIEKVFYPVFPPNQHAQEVLLWLKSHPEGTTAIDPADNQAP